MSVIPHGLRVLVVEDSRTQAEALRALLAREGCDVRVARSGREALAMLRRASADLMISDVIMPEMSGLELCVALRADPALHEVPVILLTSLADPLDVLHGLQCGADNYATKPYDPEQLLDRIARTLAMRAGESRRLEPPIEIALLGERFTVRAGRRQILDVLASSFEDIARTNRALRAAEEERERLYEQEREARLEAEEARQRAEEANRAKSEFLAMMSHDLRTPLNAIGGYSELLALGVRGPMTPQQLADLERIQRNQRHLLTLVNDVLNFARLETGEIPLTIRPHVLDPILRPLRAVIEPQTQTRGLTYDYAGCDAVVSVMVDAERLEQILINLLGNAVKFTPDGGRIAMRCSATATGAQIQVSDTGIGIPPEKLDAIFDPFVQVDSTRANREGVGLGLAISRKLARAMKGDIVVQSQVGGGSTFTVTLPLA